MTHGDRETGDVPSQLRVPLAMIGAAALAAGLYARFKGIGRWPLGVDEFYISRSIDNILRTGLPHFRCGGFYNRGALYQYLVAAARLTGATPELAGRAVAGALSVLALPAGYRLGERTGGALVGWVTVIILSLSVWEIEMARFARMYAPFQAVFLWYALVYLRYTVDRSWKALGGLMALSLIGALTWEGGVLMGVANMLAIVATHERGRLRRADLGRLAVLVLWLVVLYELGTNDFRGMNEAGADTGMSGGHGRLFGAAFEWLALLRTHGLWALGWVCALAPAAASARWVASMRARPLAAAALLAVLVAAAAHLFALAAGVLALALVMRLLDLPELTGARSRGFLLSLAALLAFWLAFDHGVGLPSVPPAPATGTSAPALFLDLFGIPDLYDSLIRPWGRTLPWLSIGLGLALAYLYVRIVADRRDAREPATVVMGLLLAMVLAVGATRTERIETRYTFFLYPLIIVAAATSLEILMRRLLSWRRLPAALAGSPATVAAALALLFFASTEDFQPRHLASVDSARTNFRVGMSPVRAAHYYPRNDMRAVGEWLAAHVQPGDVVVTGIPNLDPYYGGIDYLYIDGEDERYEAYVCPDGRTDRWTDHPLLHGQAALMSLLATGHRVFATVYPDTEARLLAQSARGWSVRRVWSTDYGHTDVLLLTAQAAPAGS
jgi:hypothetical protein